MDLGSSGLFSLALFPSQRKATNSVQNNMVEILQGSLQASVALKDFHQLLACGGFLAVIGLL